MPNASTMKKTSIKPLPDYFDRYINLTSDNDLGYVLQESLEVLNQLDLKKLEKIGGKVYAPGKWTVKDILQHIIDTERVFCYRSLRFARKDRTPNPGYDENSFALHAQAEKRSLEEIMNELKLLRQGTIFLFKSFNDEMLLEKGMCWKYEMSVLAMGFTIAGHQIHHLNVMKEKYYPLA
jgi:hypothetical protein